MAKEVPEWAQRRAQTWKTITDKVLVQASDATSVGEKKAERWTSDEQELMWNGLRALLKKDTSGRRLRDQMHTELQRHGLVIDEKSFFRPHGPYSMMMPDVHENMLNLVAVRRKQLNEEYTESVDAVDESKLEDLQRLAGLVGQAQEGDLTPNQSKKLVTEIEKIREDIKQYIIANKKPSSAETDAEQVDEEEEETSSDTKKPQNRQINVPWKEKWDKIQMKNQWKKEWEKKRDITKEWSDFTEKFMVLANAKLGWAGDEGVVIARAPAEYDDIFNATDGIVQMERELVDDKGEREIVGQTYAYDTTLSADEGIQKTANTLRFIDMALLTKLEFAQTYDKHGNVIAEGMQSLVPRLNYVISRPLAAEIAILVKNDRFDMLAVHPMQLMILRQAQAQINAYMSYIETEYSRDQRRKDNKEKIIDTFARLRDLINAAAEEREDLLREDFDGLTQALKERELTVKERERLAMLVRGSVLWTGDAGDYGESYDREHGDYVRAFRSDRMDRVIHREYVDNVPLVDRQGPRTGGHSRLTALLRKYPPLKTEEDLAGDKEKRPVPMPDKRKGKLFEGKTRKSRRSEFKKKRTKEVDVVNTTSSDVTEA